MAAESRTKQNPASRGARRRRRLLFTLAGLFCLWFGAALWEQTGAVEEKREELQQLQTKLEELRTENDSYKTEITRLHDPEYLEQKVRKNFGMARPGDKLFTTPAD